MHKSDYFKEIWMFINLSKIWSKRDMIEYLKNLQKWKYTDPSLPGQHELPPSPIRRLPKDVYSIKKSLFRFKVTYSMRIKWPDLLDVRPVFVWGARVVCTHTVLGQKLQFLKCYQFFELGKIAFEKISHSLCLDATTWASWKWAIDTCCPLSSPQKYVSLVSFWITGRPVWVLRWGLGYFLLWVPRIAWEEG